MSTVGELVDARWLEERQRIPGGSQRGCMEYILTSLGIWDAEVLEGELDVRGYTECGCEVDVVAEEIVDGGWRVVGHIGDNHSGKFAGSPVCVIVLPSLEEGK